jgi:hypothetical protein
VREVCQKRLKIGETFRDCKDLLHLPKLTNKQQRHLEQMIALLLIVSVIGFWCGETIRNVVCGKLPSEQLKDNLSGNTQVDNVRFPNS